MKNKYYQNFKWKLMDADHMLIPYHNHFNGLVTSAQTKKEMLEPHL